MRPSLCNITHLLKRLVLSNIGGNHSRHLLGLKKDAEPKTVDTCEEDGSVFKTVGKSKGGVKPVKPVNPCVHRTQFFTHQHCY
jgi:hypothetical protein